MGIVCDTAIDGEPGQSADLEFVSIPRVGDRVYLKEGWSARVYQVTHFPADPKQEFEMAPSVRVFLKREPEVFDEDD